MNKQDWEKEFDKAFGKQKMQLKYVGNIVGMKIYSQEFKQEEVVDIAEAKKFIKKQITKASEEAVKGVLALPKHEYLPVGGLSNQKFVFVIDIEKYLKSLEDKK